MLVLSFDWFVDPNLSGPQSDWLSTLFDVGGIIGKYLLVIVCLVQMLIHLLLGKGRHFLTMSMVIQWLFQLGISLRLYWLNFSYVQYTMYMDERTTFLSTQCACMYMSKFMNMQERVFWWGVHNIPCFNGTWTCHICRSLVCTLSTVYTCIDDICLSYQIYIDSNTHTAPVLLQCHV